MVVDPRHDHSLRFHGPTCRRGRHAQCLQRLPHGQIGRLGGRSDRALARAKPEGLSALRRSVPCGAEPPIGCWGSLAVVAADKNAPAIARATALTELAPLVSPSNINLARAGLSDPDPMVRIGALDMLENVPPAQTWPFASPLLTDPVRGVRIRAAELFAAVPSTNQLPADRERFAQAASEFIAAQRFNADLP